MKLIIVLRIEDIEIPCKIPLPLPSDDTKSITFVRPFALDGISPELSICIECAIRVGSYNAPVTSTSFPVSRLTFSATNSLSYIHSPRRRHSIHNRTGYCQDDRMDETTNLLTIDGMNISYVADKCSGLIRLYVKSINMPAPIDLIKSTLNKRNETQILIEIPNEGTFISYTTLSVFSNNSRLYRWLLSDTIDHDVVLTWKRVILFPREDTGIADKLLCVKLKPLDFEATIKRNEALELPAAGHLVLERGIRQGILLKVFFIDQMVVSIELMIDDFDVTVEREFKMA